MPLAGHPELQYQPHSALVTCNAGERVLLRFANLGFREAAMTLAGIRMKVVGRDATPMKGRDGTDTSYETDTLLMGAGESYDAIFTAPAYQGPGPMILMCFITAATPRMMILRMAPRVSALKCASIPATLPPQTHFNQHPDDTVL